jgi:hypothetical protein
MKVFISYSVHDTTFVKTIADQLRPIAEQVLWWEESKEPGREVWPSIFGWIDQSDLILAVITDKTVTRAMAVGNEIGRAKTKGKPVIPLIAPDVKAGKLGCLSGVTYQQIDRGNPGPAMEAVKKVLLRMKKSAAEEQQRQLAVLLGIVGLLWLLGSGK